MECETKCAPAVELSQPPFLGKKYAIRRLYHSPYLFAQDEYLGNFSRCRVEDAALFVDVLNAARAALRFHTVSNPVELVSVQYEATTETVTEPGRSRRKFVCVVGHDFCPHVSGNSYFFAFRNPKTHSEYFCGDTSWPWGEGDDGINEAALFPTTKEALSALLHSAASLAPYSTSWNVEMVVVDKQDIPDTIRTVTTYHPVITPL